MAWPCPFLWSRLSLKRIASWTLWNRLPRCQYLVVALATDREYAPGTRKKTRALERAALSTIILFLRCTDKSYTTDFNDNHKSTGNHYGQYCGSLVVVLSLELITWVDSLRKKHTKTHTQTCCRLVLVQRRLSGSSRFRHKGTYHVVDTMTGNR